MLGAPSWGLMADKFGRKWVSDYYDVTYLYTTHKAMYMCTYAYAHIWNFLNWQVPMYSQPAFHDPGLEVL